jgi:AAA+ ATPase superfamily predicted ATPase
MTKVVARQAEQAILQEALTSRDPEFIAVYGRRRVGKTHLVRGFFGTRAHLFELTGMKDASLRAQLGNFADILGKSFGSRLPVPVPASWLDAMKLLAAAVEERGSRQNVVLFFDELPWLAGRRSGFLEALGYFWNSWVSRFPHVSVVVCGSAASWMLDRVIHHKGSLHNRITRRIRLLPFSLRETKAYLRYRKVFLSTRQLLEIYMVMGGVPAYLNQVRPGQSAAQNIDIACFSKDGYLADEFDLLYASLFTKAERHRKAVELMAQHPGGVTRQMLIEATGLAGGALTGVLRALGESGFISVDVPLGKRSRDSTYRLIDEYTLFYLRWIRKAPKRVFTSNESGYWLQNYATPAWRVWAGLAFEAVCRKHTREIRHALSIGGVAATEATWFYRPRSKDEDGAQIDLLFDRADQCVTLCEMKFTDSPYRITKRYAGDLRRKLTVFRQHTNSRKSLFLVMVTAEGLTPNTYSDELVSAVVTAEDLLR